MTSPPDEIKNPPNFSMVGTWSPWNFMISINHHQPMFHPRCCFVYNQTLSGRSFPSSWNFALVLLPFNQMGFLYVSLSCHQHPVSSVLSQGGKTSPLMNNRISVKTLIWRIEGTICSCHSNNIPWLSYFDQYDDFPTWLRISLLYHVLFTVNLKLFFWCNLAIGVNIWSLVRVKIKLAIPIQWNRFQYMIDSFSTLHHLELFQLIRKICPIGKHIPIYFWISFWYSIPIPGMLHNASYIPIGK